MNSDCQAPCERRASVPRNQVTEMSKDYFWRAAARCVVPCARQILPVIYRRLTIPGHLWRYSGTLPRAGHQGQVMRIFGSNAAARSRTRPRRAARRPAVSRSTRARRRNRRSRRLASHHRRHRRADRAAGSGRPGRAAAPRGQARPDALDALDELKIEVLGGTLGPSTLMRLKSATADLRDASGDDRLDSVLAEIELRLEVEIAKMGPPR